MSFVRHRLTWLNWLALVAMLALALIPTVSRALAWAEPGTPWAEICSVAGNRLAPAADSGDLASPSGATHLDHCALCGVGAGPLGLPVDVATHAAPQAGASWRANRPVATPPALYAWARSRPRGPPWIS